MTQPEALVIIITLVIVLVAIDFLAVAAQRRRNRNPRVARQTHEPVTPTTRRRPVFTPSEED